MSRGILNIIIYQERRDPHRAISNLTLTFGAMAGIRRDISLSMVSRSNFVFAQTMTGRVYRCNVRETGVVQITH